MQRSDGPARTWVVGAVAVALLAAGGVSFSRRVVAVEPLAGIEWIRSSSGPLALSVDPAGPGWEAGVRPGDELVAVDGEAIESAVEASDLPWRLRLDRAAVLELRRGGRTLRAELRPDWQPVAPRAPIYGYLALVGLGFLLSGTFIALRWPTIRGGPVYSLLAATLFVLLAFSPTGRADAVDRLVSWMDIAAGAFAPALLLHLALNLSRRVWRQRGVAIAASYLPTAALLLASLWLAAGGQYRFEDPVRALEVRDRLQMLFLGVAVPVAAGMLLRSYLRSASGLHRSQARWMLWGLAAGLLPFVVLYALPWSLGADTPSWVATSVFPMLLVPAAFTAALARYRLHDLDLLVRRGLTEVTAVLLTAAVYAASQYVIRREGLGWLPLSNSAARYAGIVLILAAFTPLRAWCRVWVDRAFFRRRYSYRATLLDWARELNLETDLASLMEGIRQRVRATLDVPEARVFLRTAAATFEGPSGDEDEGPLDLTAEQLERLERQPCVALAEDELVRAPWARYLFGMRVKGRLRAMLAVAERRDAGSPFSSEDRALLATVAAQAGTALEAARLLDEVRRGAEKVERLQARQETILESSGVGLLLVNDGRIMAWNRALEAIYALPRAEALGRRLGDVFPLHLVRALERESRRLAGGGEARLHRYGLANKAGQPRVVNVSIAAADRGESGTLVVAFDDVTEVVKLEDQVQQQERLASLGLLAAGVAHEVNTPLTGISSYAQMLLEEFGPGDARREVLAKIESQVARASNIANSLLNLARPQPASFEALSLNDTVRDALRLFEPQARGGGVRVESRLRPDLPAVRGDRGRLQQVLLNLLLNARDAVGSKGCITLTTESADGRVVLEVADDGVGIAEEDLPRIFDPFFTTKRRGKGSGLGLSVTYGIVRQHGGEIEVESVPGAFTRFRVVLPAATPDTARKVGEP